MSNNRLINPLNSVFIIFAVGAIVMLTCSLLGS